MARYSVGVPVALAAANAPCLTITAGALEIRIDMIWFAETVAETSAPQLALYRPSNTPVATTSVLGQAEDPADAASVTNLDTAWSTAPTIPASGHFRRLRTKGTTGEQIVWYWGDRPLVVAPSGRLVLWNHGTSPLTGGVATVAWEE